MSDKIEFTMLAIADSARQLQSLVDIVIEEWRKRAAAGDETAAFVLSLYDAKDSE